VQLRGYQQDSERDIYAAWQRGARNILYLLPTGGGKTVQVASIVRNHTGHSLTAAHRRELVSQISLALAANGVTHSIIAPKAVVRDIIQIQMADIGRSYFDPNSVRHVASVDTLLARSSELEQLLSRITLWVQDEAHHVLRENKWGKLAAMIPNAFGLGVTANTVRADGKGLGAHAHGVFEELIEGPPMRSLINQGYLTDYKIFAPPSDLNLSGVKISAATGDYNPSQLKNRVRKSHIVGDVVDHYLKLVPGKLGITFASDIETAGDIAAKFNGHGVPAELVTAKTPDKVRAEIMRRLRRGDLKQVVNVDLFGEGVDVPAISVVSMARPTESFNLFCQQFGRALRILPGKDLAYIIDHVGNVMRHGLPDAKQTWTLDARERGTRGKRDPDMIPVRACPECTAIYERVYKGCPYCGHVVVPALRSAPEFVDGDLAELDAETLAAMRGEVRKVDKSADSVQRGMERNSHSYIVAKGAANQHVKRQEAQEVLRDAIALWAGHQRAAGRDDSESYRRFWFNFGVDVMGAQALGRPEAEALTEKINNAIIHNVNKIC